MRAIVSLQKSCHVGIIYQTRQVSEKIILLLWQTDQQLSEAISPFFSIGTQIFPTMWNILEKEPPAIYQSIPFPNLHNLPIYSTSTFTLPSSLPHHSHNSLKPPHLKPLNPPVPHPSPYLTPRNIPSILSPIFFISSAIFRIPSANLSAPLPILPFPTAEPPTSRNILSVNPFHSPNTSLAKSSRPSLRVEEERV